jgi:hypothetical protein
MLERVSLPLRNLSDSIPGYLNPCFSSVNFLKPNSWNILFYILYNICVLCMYPVAVIKHLIDWIIFKSLIYASFWIVIMLTKTWTCDIDQGHVLLKIYSQLKYTLAPSKILKHHSIWS